MSQFCNSNKVLTRDGHHNSGVELNKDNQKGTIPQKPKSPALTFSVQGQEVFSACAIESLLNNESTPQDRIITIPDEVHTSLLFCALQDDIQDQAVIEEINDSVSDAQPQSVDINASRPDTPCCIKPPSRQSTDTNVSTSPRSRPASSRSIKPPGSLNSRNSGKPELKLKKTTENDKKTTGLETNKKKGGGQASGAVLSSKTSPSGIPRRINSGLTKASVGLKQPTNSPDKKGQQSKPQTPSKAHPGIQSRNAEYLFKNKKRQFEQLKKEFEEKQKPLLESYKALRQLKEQLEKSTGKPIELGVLETVWYDEKGNIRHEADGDGRKLSIDQNIFENMKKTVEQLANSSLDMCKEVVTRRMAVVQILEELKSGDDNEMSGLGNRLHSVNQDTEEINSMLHQTFVVQEKLVESTFQYWQTLISCQNPDGTASNSETELLKQKLYEQEKRLQEVMETLQKAQDHSASIMCRSASTIEELKAKIKDVEVLLHTQEDTANHQKEQHEEDKVRLSKMRKQLQDKEQEHQKLERKIEGLERSLHSAEGANRTMEKERRELLKASDCDKQLLQKLIKDKASIDNRMKSTEEEKESTYFRLRKIEESAKQELEMFRMLYIKEQEDRQDLEEKYASLQDQLVKMELARDMADKSNGSLGTSNEAELYTELLATKVALKEAEERLAAYGKEKIRFIEAIQLLHSDDESEKVARDLVENTERVLVLEANLSSSQEVVEKQKLEITSLKSQIEVLQPNGGDHEDRARMGQISQQECRYNLDKMLKKMLGYEQRILKHQYEAEQQKKQLGEMENLLKNRDDLITVMKAKKDELVLDSESLNRYASDMRESLLQVKEELVNRNAMIQELTGVVEKKEKTCELLQKEVKKLEMTLYHANRKRYKLQDAVTEMEKQLQKTKLQTPYFQTELHKGR